MTEQTKHLIELGDVATIDFECTSCGAMVSLVIANDIHSAPPRQCVNCHNDFIPYDSKIAEYVMGFLRYMRLIREYTDQKRVGFRFRMGLKAAPGKANNETT